MVGSDVFPIEIVPFQVRTVSFREGNVSRLERGGFRIESMYFSMKNGGYSSHVNLLEGK